MSYVRRERESPRDVRRRSKRDFCVLEAREEEGMKSEEKTPKKEGEEERRETEGEE